MAELIAECDELIADGDDSADPVARRRMQEALLTKARAFRGAGRYHDAAAAWDAALIRAARDPAEFSAGFTVAVLIAKAIDLGRAGDHDAASNAADAATMIARDLPSGAAATRLLATALLTRRAALDKLGRVDSALTIDDELVGRLHDAEDPALRQFAAGALAHRAIHRLRQGQLEQAIADGEALLERLHAEIDPALIAATANGLLRYDRELLTVAGSSGRDVISLAALLVGSGVAHSGQRLARHTRFPRLPGIATLMPQRVRALSVRAAEAQRVAEALDRELRDADDEELQGIAANACFYRAVARLQQGHVIECYRAMSRLTHSGSEAVAAAFEREARNRRGDETLAGELGLVSNLAMRALTLGQGDSPIARIAFEESIRPGAPNAPRSRRARLIARLLHPG